MSMQAFYTNVGDIVEGILKKVGLGDDAAKHVGDGAAAILSDFTTKWMSDEKAALLVLAKTFVASVVADPSTFLSAAEQLVVAAASQSLTITIDDARDAIRVHLLAA